MGVRRKKRRKQEQHKLRLLVRDEKRTGAKNTVSSL